MKRILLSALVLLAGIAASTDARAAFLENVNMTFQSGATFSGVVTFADDYSYFSDVSGTLTGGGYGSQAMTWVWGNGGDGDNSGAGANFSLTPNTFQNWFVSGTNESNYDAYISFAYDFSNAPTLLFANVGYGNNVNYSDLMVSGSISAVPLPAALPLFVSGIAGLAAAARRRKAA